MKSWKNWLLTAMSIWLLITLFPPFIGGNSNDEEKFIGFHFLFGTPKYIGNENVQRSYAQVNGEKNLSAKNDIILK